MTGAGSRLVEGLRHLGEAGRDHLVVALDGRSGAGKSTLTAAVVASLPDCGVIEGDSFYAGEPAESWDALPPEEQVDRVIDWRRQRPVLEALRRGEAAVWHGFDWDAFDGRLEVTPTTCEPARFVILDGAYSARPELADLIDLRVLLVTPDAVRLRRLRRREGESFADDWTARWSAAEDHYFGVVMPAEAFDLVL